MTARSQQEETIAAPAISLSGVSVRYTPAESVAVSALDDVAVDVACGEFLVVTGRSGSGKTTLLNAMAGLVCPTTGTVLVSGVDLWAITDDARSARRNESVGFVFQFPSLMPMLTVRENVLLPAAFAPRADSAAIADRATELLQTVGLAEKADVYPRHLSAGQQQRVVLARALVREPAIILADEPTSNLDEQTECEMLELLRSVHAATGVTIVMVTHAPALAAFGTRTIRMEQGRIVS